MPKSKIVLFSLLHALGVVVYIVGIRYAIELSSNLFTGSAEFSGFILVLLLLVFSVAVMAVLVFGRPVYLFLNGMKSEAIKFLLYTLGWMFVLLVIVFSLTVVLEAAPAPSTNLGASTIVD